MKVLLRPVTGTAENRKSGEIPEWYRHCERGDPAEAKAGHWGNLRRPAEIYDA